MEPQRDYMMCREVQLDLARTLVGVATLLVGTLLYLVDRPSGSICFIPDSFSLFDQTPMAFGALGQNMPTFVHAFALTLITAGIISCRTTGSAAGVSLVWFIVDAAFEFGQYPDIGKQLAASIPAWFQEIPILENARGYFLRGTFDVWDLVSIAAGASSAFILLQVTKWRTTA